MFTIISHIGKVLNGRAVCNGAWQVGVILCFSGESARRRNMEGP